MLALLTTIASMPLLSVRITYHPLANVLIADGYADDEAHRIAAHSLWLVPVLCLVVNASAMRDVKRRKRSAASVRLALSGLVLSALWIPIGFWATAWAIAWQSWNPG